jgi:hypothetical protein
MSLGIVRVNGQPIVGSAVEADGVLTVTVQSAEWAGLEVAVGEAVTVWRPGRKEVRLLVSAAEPAKGAATAVRFCRPVV